MFRPIRDALDLVKEAVHVINKSPKRSEIFTSKQVENHPFIGTRSLKPLCSTCWTVRIEAISAVLDKYEAVQATMEDVNAEGGNVGTKAGGVLARLARFSTLVYDCPILYSAQERNYPEPYKVQTTMYKSLLMPLI